MSRDDRIPICGRLICWTRNSKREISNSSRGIAYKAQHFVADLDYATPVNITGNEASYFPAWLTVDTFSHDHPTTAGLSVMLLPEAGSFQLKADSTLTLTPLIVSTQQSQSLPTTALLMTDPEQLVRQVQPDGQQAIIAGLITGQFTTAFPDGKPVDAESEKIQAEITRHAMPDPGTEIEVDPNQLKASRGQSTLFLIADTDFLADAFSVRTLNFLGVSSIQPFNDNLAFISNIVDFLSGSQDLISLRGKGSVVRPFKRLEDLGRRAQEKYQEQLTGLEQRLQAVQDRLRELQSQQNEETVLVLSPEMRDALDEIRSQEAALRAERRELRKKLREDIERLDRTLALINLVPLPLLILIFGVCYSAKRNNRHKKQCS